MIGLLRRLRFLLGAVLIAGAVWLVAFTGSSSPRPYRFDAIFDVARGIGPEQVVKVAGAKVGTVTAVKLTSDDKARVEMAVDADFGPFRADASCQIEPEGVISENFVECSPGSPSEPVLAADSSGTPTVPVTHTAEPVSLQDLFDIWTVPTSERLSVLLDDLGIGVSGRAGDIQAILDRANPALAAAQRAVGLVNRQKNQLLELLDAARPVIGDLAAHDRSVQRFLTTGARLTQVTADHAGALSADIAHLPALLRSAQPALVELDELGSGTVPLLNRLRASSGELLQVTDELPTFSSQGVATLTDLAPSLSRASTALREATPTLKLADTFATDADPAGESLDQLLVSLRDSGTFESLLRGFYNGAALTSHYDAGSHVIFADLLANQCMVYATVPSSACDAHLNGTATIPGEPDQRRGHAGRSSRAAAITSRPTVTTTTGVQVPSVPVTSRTTATVTATPATPATPTSPAGSSVATTLSQLLSYLLK